MINTRCATADPEDMNAARRVVAECLRVKRSDELLAPLLDRQVWNKTSHGEQNIAVMEVARRHPEFEFLRMQTWECPIHDRYRDADGATTQQNAHRLGVFRHPVIGSEFSLVPGRDERCRHIEFYGKRKKTGLTVRIDPFKLNRSAWNKTLDEMDSCDCHHGCRVIDPLFVGRWPITIKDWISERHPHGKGISDSLVEDVPQTGHSAAGARHWLEPMGMRLPTKSEWHHNARGGSCTKFFWGPSFDDRYVWFYENSGTLENDTGESSGVFTPQLRAPREHEDAGFWNAFGLVDAVGNVFEWCDGGVARGGSYMTYYEDIVRTLFGDFQHDSNEYLHDVGLRAVCSVRGGDAFR